MADGRIGSWIEWRTRCALGACGPETQADLTGFAASRFHRLAQRFSFLTNLGGGRASGVDAREAWHLFETRLVVDATTGGKRYKDWLFARVRGEGEDALDAVQGGATLIMRDVVRAWLRREYSPAQTVSIHAAQGGDAAAGPTLEDLLPGRGDDPAEEAARSDLQAIADGQGARFAEEATRRERIAVTAKALGLSLAHADVARVAGCGHSRLNDAYHAFVRSAAERLRENFPGEGPQGLQYLALRALETAKERVCAWARSEKDCAPLFRLVEGQVQ